MRLASPRCRVLVYSWEGKDAEAEALYHRALTILEKAFGKDHRPSPDYRIVYFATHGLVAGDVKGSPSHPWRSPFRGCRASWTMACSPRARWHSSSSMPTG